MEFSMQDWMDYFDKIGFGKIPDILPPTWKLYTTIQCPSCGTSMHYDSTDTDPIERHVFCPTKECVQSKRIYTVLISPYGCEIKDSIERKANDTTTA